MIFTVLCFFSQVLTAQTETSSLYPFEHGMIKYEYEGNSEGSRTIYFTDYGNKTALFTNVSRSSTFYSITTTSIENVAEYLIDNVHYHFDLENKKALTLDSSIDLLSKYLHLPADYSDLNQLLEELNAEYFGMEKIIAYDCQHWKLNNKEFWIHDGLLLKLTSNGLNKNFSLFATEVDFQSEVEDLIFSFPKDIPLKR